MPGQIQCHQIQTLQIFGHRQKTGRIIQPAMQGQHWPAVPMVAQRAEAPLRGIEKDFAHHAQPESEMASAANASACAALALRHGI